jgi:hypothetical protein
MFSHDCLNKYISVTKLRQDRQCTYNVTLRRVRATIVVVEQQYVSTHSEYVSIVLGMPHIMYMRHIIGGLTGYPIFFHIVS